MDKSITETLLGILLILSIVMNIKQYNDLEHEKQTFKDLQLSTEFYESGDIKTIYTRYDKVTIFPNPKPGEQEASTEMIHHGPCMVFSPNSAAGHCDFYIHGEKIDMCSVFTYGGIRIKAINHPADIDSGR